jgi:hypothetical protein
MDGSQHLQSTMMADEIPGLANELAALRQRRIERCDLMARRFERFDEVARAVAARLTEAVAQSGGLLTLLRSPGGRETIPLAREIARDLAAAYPLRLALVDEDGEVRAGPFLDVTLDAYPLVAFRFRGNFRRFHAGIVEGDFDGADFFVDQVDWMVLGLLRLAVRFDDDQSWLRHWRTHAGATLDRWSDVRHQEPARLSPDLPGLYRHFDEVHRYRRGRREFAERRHARYEETARVIQTHLRLAAAQSDGLLVCQAPARPGGRPPTRPDDADLADLFPARLAVADPDGMVRDGPFLDVRLDARPYIAWSFSGGFRRDRSHPSEGNFDPATFYIDLLYVLLHRLVDMTN